MASNPGVHQNMMPSNFSYGVKRRGTAKRRGWDQRETLVRKPQAQQTKEDKVAQALAASQQSSERNRATTAAALQNTSAIYGTLGMLATAGAGTPAQLGKALSKVHGQGRVAQLARQLRKTNSVTEVTSLLNRLGYASPQGHHDEAATERDFNVYKGNLRPMGEGITSPAEQRRLVILMKALKRAFGGPNGVLNEAIFDPWGSYFGPGTRSKNPYGGHAAHGHVGFSQETW